MKSIPIIDENSINYDLQIASDGVIRIDSKQIPMDKIRTVKFVRKNRKRLILFGILLFICSQLVRRIPGPADLMAAIMALMVVICFYLLILGFGKSIGGRLFRYLEISYADQEGYVSNIMFRTKKTRDERGLIKEIKNAGVKI